MEAGALTTLQDARMYDVAVVEPDAPQRMRLAARLSGARQLESIEALVRAMRPGHGLVAVFGPGLVGPYGFQQVHRLTASYPELGAIFAVHQLTTDILQQALRAGARDTVVLDDDGFALGQSVERVGSLLSSGQARAAAAAPTPAPMMSQSVSPGRLIVVFSPKGGVGKSFLAINVATAMARRTDERVALVDADLQFGDIAVLLGIPPQTTLVDAAAAIQYADPELMRSLVSRHDSGLLVLPAPVEPVPGGAVSPQDVVAVCGGLQAMCKYVVVDLPTQFDEYVLALIEAADEILLVGNMDIPSVKNLKIGIQALDLMALAGSKLRLVLNRANVQVKLDVREIEQVLGLRAEFPIPNDLAVPIAVNAGIPVVMNDPNSAASRAIQNIATSLLGPGGRPAAGDRQRKSKFALSLRK
ncbi:MAG: hypothetical protein E6G60_07370 [Actinobacteria bacterium]|nr:MAG: hypothetical protein E6G60_07370 [Actinomycetota bacterium]